MYRLLSAIVFTLHEIISVKISYAGCLGLFPAISSQLSVEVCAASKN